MAGRFQGKNGRAEWLDGEILQVVILAGGLGTRLSEETHAIPKPMVRIGSQPILWHIMQHYAAYGFDEFVIALGYRGYVVKEYFSNLAKHQSDLRVDLSSGNIEVLENRSPSWRVTLVDTGLHTMTGGRLGRLREYLDSTFLLTYGDGLADVNIDELVSFHRSGELSATVTAVHPKPRFGSLEIEDGTVRSFSEKTGRGHDRINGGFFVLEPEILDLVDGDGCVFESGPLAGLAARGQLAAYEHDGFWQPMDTVRERDELNQIWADGAAPWGRR